MPLVPSEADRPLREGAFGGEGIQGLDERQRPGEREDEADAPYGGTSSAPGRLGHPRGPWQARARRLSDSIARDPHPDGTVPPQIPKGHTIPGTRATFPSSPF